MASPDPGLSLYLHVPFCTDKCLYCDFFSVPRGSVPPSVITRVVEQTVELAQTLWDASGRAPLRTLFIGGGTPSCLPPSLLRRLLGPFVGQGVVEWTVESNPETLSQAFLDECEAAGVTRLSLGIQSLSSELLQRVRRRATREQSLSAIDLLRRKWRGQVNLDFITGIPGQTQDDVGECLSVIQPQWPDHVSLYQLTVEPGTPLEAGVADRSIRLNEPEKDEDLWLAGREGLLSRGFRQYEVSNFARPGRECRHNVRYWMIQPYAGAGPGAVSTIPSAWASRLAGLMLPTA
ncbi:MAG TPA: coproporphyrinogen-III oxidase family protein, partial [Spirochaetia bacterium]|nr:coproporphyrinogen-III oxidase family protein [Spirochaetia bacterium]